MKKTLSQSELCSLVRLWQDHGDTRARNTVVEANMGLVHTIANQILRKRGDYNDLVQQGALGLMRAVSGFDTSMGTLFSTYAKSWIRKFMTDWTFRNWSMCGSKSLLRSKTFFRVVRSRRAALSKTADASEVADIVAKDMGLSVDKIEDFFWRLDYCDVSLDAHKFGGDGRERAIDNVIAGEPTPEQHAIEVEDFRKSRAKVNRAMRRLSDQQRRVLFAILQDDEVTLQEIGNRLGISRQRVQQIRNQAFKHIQAA